MTPGDWFTTPENWVFLILAVAMLFTASRVVTTRNVVHAVLYLVATLAIVAVFFLLLGAEFVAWTVVLISIGAVVVLFLFGIMITKAPMGTETSLSHPNRVRVPAAIVSFLLFVFVGGAVLIGFSDAQFEPAVTRAAGIGDVIFSRWVIPFEVVSVLLLAALIGGIVLARRDPPEVEEELAMEALIASDPGGGDEPAEEAAPEPAEEPEPAEATAALEAVEAMRSREGQ